MPEQREGERRLVKIRLHMGPRLTRRFKLDRMGGEWYWRRPDQLPYQVGPYRTRVVAWLAAWRATRKERP